MDKLPKDSIPLHMSRLLSKHAKTLSETTEQGQFNKIRHIVHFEPVMKEIKTDNGIKNNNKENK